MSRARVADAEEIFEAYGSDDRVTRYLTWQPHSAIEPLYEFLQGLEHRWELGEEVAWSIREREGGGIIGMVAVRLSEHVADLGYVLAFDHWGQGIMTEAVTAVVDTARRRPEIFRITAVHDVENPASGRVMAKAGLQYEGRMGRHTVHPNISTEPRDVDAYAWTR